MKIIGITGTNGAGKGTIVDFLIRKKGFAHFSVRTYLIEIIKSQGNEPTREVMIQTANKLRTEHSPSYLIEELYKMAVKKGDNCIIESIRTPGEIEALRKLGNFKLLAVDALPEKRYERIVKRGSETDSVSFNTFIENEKREMSSNNPNEQNLSKCMGMADVVVENNEGIEELESKLEKIYLTL